MHWRQNARSGAAQIAMLACSDWRRQCTRCARQCLITQRGEERHTSGMPPPGDTNPGLAPGRCGMPENGVMKDMPPGRSGWMHLAWAMWLPCASAVVVGGLFAVVDLAGMVMGSWDTPVAGPGWLKDGAIGQFGPATPAGAGLSAGAARP